MNDQKVCFIDACWVTARRGTLACNLLNVAWSTTVYGVPATAQACPVGLSNRWLSTCGHAPNGSRNHAPLNAGSGSGICMYIHPVGPKVALRQAAPTALTYYIDSIYTTKVCKEASRPEPTLEALSARNST